jgi:hypothetical protein
VTIHFLDTSAWAKRYVKEPGTDWLRAWHASDPVISVSSVGVVEVLSTLARRQTHGDLDPTTFRRLYASALKDATGFITIALGPDVLEIAIALPMTTPLRGADTIQLASLLHIARLADTDEEVVLVSADRELNGAAVDSGFAVIDPVGEEQR